MIKKILIWLGVFVVGFFLFLIWFQSAYSMDKIDSYEINKSSQSHKVLIASQGSEYKISTVKGITDHFKNDSVYFKVVDVSLLSDVKPNNWDAIIILHTWEIWKPEENAKLFLNDSYDASKMFVIATSMSGESGNQIEGVDGLTGPSDLGKVVNNVEKVVKWLDEILEE